MSENDDPVDRALALMNAAMTSVMNQRWDEAEGKFASARKQTALLDEEYREVLEGILDVIQEMGRGLSLLMASDEAARLEQLMKQLAVLQEFLVKVAGGLAETKEFGEQGGTVEGAAETLGEVREAVKESETLAAPLAAIRGARQKLGELREQFPEHEKLLAGLAPPLELQIVGQELQSAKRRGDEAEMASLAVQHELLMKKVSAADESGGMDHQMKALTGALEISKAFVATSKALQKMDLSAALGCIGEARTKAAEVEELLETQPFEGVIFEAVRQQSLGFVLLVDALESYVSALHHAVVGDVTRDHIRRLERAGSDIKHGWEEVINAARIMRYASAEQIEAMRAESERLQVLIRNLTHLCSQSLTPKQASRTGSVKFVFLFLVSFVVLLLTLPVTGLVESIGVTELGIAVLTAFLVGLIGGFGYEALRFLPLIDRLISFLELGRGGTKAVEE